MSLDEGCFLRCLVSDSIILKPHRVGRNIQDVILSKLRDAFEGVCSRHGYILPGSVRLHHASHGSLEGANLNGDVRYNLQYHAMVCNPAIGSTIAARVVNKSRFGFLLHSGANPVGGNAVAPLSSVVESVVSRQATYSDLPSPGMFIDLDTVQIGDVVNVCVMGKKFQLNDQHIFVVGRIVAGVPDPAPSRVPAIGDNNDEDLSVIAATEISADERDVKTGGSDNDSDDDSDESDSDTDTEGDVRTESNSDDEDDTHDTDTEKATDNDTDTDTGPGLEAKMRPGIPGSNTSASDLDTDSDEGTDAEAGQNADSEADTDDFAVGRFARRSKNIPDTTASVVGDTDADVDLDDDSDSGSCSDGDM